MESICLHLARLTIYVQRKIKMILYNARAQDHSTQGTKAGRPQVWDELVQNPKGKAVSKTNKDNNYSKVIPCNNHLPPTRAVMNGHEFKIIQVCSRTVLESKGPTPLHCIISRLWVMLKSYRSSRRSGELMDSLAPGETLSTFTLLGTFNFTVLSPFISF